MRPISNRKSVARTRIVACSMALALVLSACSLINSQELAQNITPIPPSLSNTSWLHHRKCPPPCWYGLEPSKSTKDETLRVLKSLPFIDPEKMGTIDENYLEYGTERIWFECRLAAGRDCGSVEFAEGILTEIRISPNDAMSTRDLVEIIGPPDYVYISGVFPTDSILKLAWVDSHLMAWHIDKGSALIERIRNEGYRIPPDLSIDDIYIEGRDIISWVSDPYSRSEWKGFIK